MRSHLPTIALVCALAGGQIAAAESQFMSHTPSDASNPMALGVDDAGKRRHIYEDPAMQAAFDLIGFDFLMQHIHGEPRIADVQRLAEWARKTARGFMLNQENTARPRGPADVYRKPGFFFQPSAEYVQAAMASPQFMGICYDEAEHWATNGVWITGRRPEALPGFQPHFYDANGDTLEEAYEGNLHNLRLLLQRHYGGFADAARRPPNAPIVATEHVFPIFFHLFARVGIAPIPKYMKETVQPVAAACAMGAARQYGTEYWACLDLWGPAQGWPGHSVDELRSSMLFSYWTGAQKAYIENFNYRDALYRVVDGKPVLNEWGEAARWFKRQYMPANPRPIRIEDFAPEIIIIRFEDSDWGQVQRSYIRQNLYGADNLRPDEQTRYWAKIWHVISHGQIPPHGLTWHADYTIRYRFFFAANNVAVYDHLADRPELFASARLVFLTGKLISPQCMATLRGLVEGGLTVVAPSHLAPAGMSLEAGAPYREYRAGRGRWLITDDVTADPVRQLLAPYLGRGDELRYVFGRREVIFTAPDNPASIQVTVRERAP